MRYPARFEVDPDGGCVVTFRDIPEAITQGDTVAEAQDMAVDALISALEFYFEDQRKVPVASAIEPGEYWVQLPASVWAKVLLLNTMLDRRIKQVDLARLAGIRPQEVTRLVNLRHATKIDLLQHVLGALGNELRISVHSFGGDKVS